MKLHTQSLQKSYENILLEEKAQSEKFQLDSNNSIKILKKNGLIIHPLKIHNRSYGLADYPEFRIKNFSYFPFHNFKSGTAIELVYQNEIIKGMFLSHDEQSSDIRLYTSEFPDWIEEPEAFIKLAVDTKTIDLLKKTISTLDEEKTTFRRKIVNHVYNDQEDFDDFETFEYKQFSKDLNESQRNSVQEILSKKPISIVHGPPGTGKTTTIVEAIQNFTYNKVKVIVTATSNAAVDYVTLKISEKGIKVLRVGNPNKINDDIIKFTLDNSLLHSDEAKLIKKLKQQANEYRKMVHQYKRNFGKDERDQRKLLIQEIKNISSEIRKIERYGKDKIINNIDVIVGTPVALSDINLSKFNFDVLFVDEAGQMLEPYFYLLTKDIKKVILAGDHLQIPPTVISHEAKQNGFDQSILEILINKGFDSVLLDTQYRMRKSIAEFSSVKFYESKIKTPDFLKNIDSHIEFYDMVGFGNQEEQDEESSSLYNSDELKLAKQIIENQNLENKTTTFISPYSAQIELAREVLPKNIIISTIDSYQGQENKTVIISLVRSNDKQEIGFLKDYRRMNVAMTRAKEKLIIIGDSATLSKDQFYIDFLQYIENIEAYHTVWEFPDMM